MAEDSEKQYKTLADVLGMKGREGMVVVATIAPKVSKIVKTAGVVPLLLNGTVATACSEKAMAALTLEQRAKVYDRMAEIGEEVACRIIDTVGECLPEFEAVVAAVNGMSVDELLDRHTVGDIYEMAKTIVSDPGFLGSLSKLSR